MATTVTCTAPVNIAVVKYWGKRDTALNLPTNSSLSVTLSQDRMCSKTTAQCAPDYQDDHFWLNGVETDIAGNARMVKCLAECRRLRREQEEADPAAVQGMWRWGVHIASHNNFPTAAGLASSASGYACLVQTLAKLYGLQVSADALSGIARMGSGSACRSLSGGFVAWDQGVRDDGSDSLARQVATRDHWPQLEAVICVVNAGRKGTPSTAGMQRTVATSELFAQRLQQVPERMAQMEAAIATRNFTDFAHLTMRDSNQFHACCLDTYPPVVYLSDVSHAIIRLVEAFNAEHVRAAYTFDAGPNAVIYTLREHVPELLAWLVRCFPAPEGQLSAYFDDPYSVAPTLGQSVPDSERLASLPVYPTGSIKQLLHVPVGDGPQVLDASQHLLDSHGQPL